MFSVYGIKASSYVDGRKKMHCKGKKQNKRRISVLRGEKGKRFPIAPRKSFI